MSQENIEILQRMFGAWNNRDFDALVEFYDPEGEFNPGLLPPGEETRYVGREGVNKWIWNVNDAWVAVTAEPEERFEVGSDRILAIDRWHFRGRDGIEIEEELPTLFTFRNGLIVRVDGFTNRAEALEAAGLSE